ncbi:MAG: hypothetical protein WC564_03880 [Patescibacteria group bacterium]|jgi:hypothetical protein
MRKIRSFINFLLFLFAANPGETGQTTSRIKDHPMLLASYGWSNTQFNAITILDMPELVLKPP